MISRWRRPMTIDEERTVDDAADDLAFHLGAWKGVQHAEAVDGDVYVEGYLSNLLEFCREWRSEIEELG